MKKPKIINLFISYLDEFSLISDEQVGALIMALLRYAKDGDKPDFASDPTLRVMFSFMSKQIDRDFEKYDETCTKRTNAAKKAAARYGKDLCETHANACD